MNKSSCVLCVKSASLVEANVKSDQERVVPGAQWVGSGTVGCASDPVLRVLSNYCSVLAQLPYLKASIVV